MAVNHAVQSGSHSMADRGRDLYETPPGATRALLRIEPLPHRIWEPAAGRGAIVNVLRDAGHAAVASDIVQYDFPLHFVGDFLEQKKVPVGVECILTNPPFDRRILARFVGHALDLCPRVVMFANLRFLESDDRTEILEHRGPVRTHIFRDRLPMMHRDGWTGEKTKQNPGAFAWFCWDRSHRGPPTVHRISHNETATAEPADPGLVTLPAPRIVPATPATLASTRKDYNMTKAPKAGKTEKVADEPKLNAAGPTPPQKPSGINPFELEGLIIQPAYKATTGMVKSTLAIPVRDKAGSATFFMTHPDPTYAPPLFALKWSEEGEETRGDWYVVHPNAAKAIEDDQALKAVRIYYNISQTGHEFLVVVPIGDGEKKDVYASKHAVFEAARSRYLKMQWVSSAMQWQHTHAAKENDSSPDVPPAWTEESYQSILKRGFATAKQDRYIGASDHYVLKALRGIRPC
jgi:hypothetical protein